MNTILVLKRGEELHTSLEKYAQESDLKSAWITGLGATEQMILGFYDLENKEYIWREFNETLEIISLTGNMSIVEGKPFWHIHGVFSDKDFQTIGGHIKELHIGGTGEFHITSLEGELTREYDEETGLKLLK